MRGMSGCCYPPPLLDFRVPQLTALTYNCLPTRNLPGYISSRFFPQLFTCPSLAETWNLPGSSRFFPQLFTCPSLAKTWNLPGSSRFFPQLFTCPSLAKTQNEITITWAKGALFSQSGVIQGHSLIHDPDLWGHVETGLGAKMDGCF